MFDQLSMTSRRICAALVFLSGLVAIGAWTSQTADPQSPPRTTNEQSPSVTIGVAADGRASDDVHVSIPLNSIQDGQFCLAYAVMHVGSPPFYFEWMGQFDDSYATSGPLGPKQIVRGNIDEGRGEYIRVDVWTNSSKTHHLGFADAFLTIDPSYPFNDDCIE